MALTDPLVTRFPNGVTDVPDTDILNALGRADPTRFISYFNDFVGGSQDFPLAATGLAAASNNYWTLTVTEGGAGNASAALTDGNGGLLTITNDAADNDLVNAQIKNESFLLAAGKKTFFKTRVKVSDATQSDFLIGLAVLDTSLLASEPTDGIYFRKDDGDTNLDFTVRLDTTTGANNVTALTTMADDTFVTMAWYYDGVSTVYYQAATDAQLTAGTAAIGSTSASSTYLPNTELTVSFSIMNGEAVAKSCTIDYIFVAQER